MTNTKCVSKSNFPFVTIIVALIQQNNVDSIEFYLNKMGEKTGAYFSQVVEEK